MTFIDRTSFSSRCVAVVLGLSLLMSAFPASFFSFNFAFAAPANVEKLVINEIHVDGSDDWIEIYNPGPSAVGAGEANRLSVHDGAATSLVVNLPNTSIAADSYVVLEVGNRFNDAGDSIELIYDNPGGSGGEEVIDDVAYGSEGSVSLPAANETISRIPNGSGDFASAVPTKDANNNPPEPIVKGTELITVRGNTFTFYDEPGTWWFNRDTDTASEFEFNEDESTIGDGALYVFPIDGSLNGDDDKFIGELFLHELVVDVESVSYNYRLGDSVPSGKANEFYANVYVNTDGSDDYGHCVYNVVPSDGTAGWHTMTFDPTMDYDVSTRNSYPGPGDCPDSPSELPDTAEIRAFVINLGDTSDSDNNVDGYFDEVVVETTEKVTTYDFEPREDVRPVFECYVDNGDDTGTGYFGYLNQNDSAVEIAISGSNNKVTGGPNGNDEGQPTTFEAGRTDFVNDGGVFKPENAAFSVDFPLSGNAVWTLDGRTATAGTGGDECPASEVDPNDQNQLRLTAIKFHNRNADKDRDDGEEKLEGWEMRFYEEIDETTWNLVATGTTNTTGEKKFTSNEAGTFYVCEVSQLGWTQVAPAEDTQTANISPNAAEEGPYCTKTVYTDEGDRSTKPEIGNIFNDPNNEHQLNISGDVYRDYAVDDCDNRNECKFNRTNDMLEGWEMRLYKEDMAGDWVQIASSTTDVDGVYRFPTQYDAGVYHTCEMLEHGYEQGIGNWSGSGYLVNTPNESGNPEEGPYCTTLTYTDAGDRSSKSHFGNVKIVDYSDVTLCKYDTEDNALAGWQLALLGTEVDSLDFVPSGATQEFSDVPAGEYVMVAEGAYEYRGNSGLLADARFSERQAGDAGFGTYPYQPWRVTNPSTGGLSISVNGDEGALWGEVFSPSHTYYGSVTVASEGDITLDLYDDNYSDNVGTIDLTLYHGATGVTGKDGCVTFEDMPYGSYEVAELLQPEWENASGLGTVEVDEDDETFDVVNIDPEYVEMCTLEIVSSDETLVVENNDYATSTYEHNNWTANLLDAIWIWDTYRVENPETDETKTFRETFTIATASEAFLEVAADNGYVAKINGETVIDRSLPDNENNYGDHTVLPPLDVTEYLIVGENVLEVVVTNLGVEDSNWQGNPAGALFRLEVTAEAGENSCVVTTEPNMSSLEITNPDTDGQTLTDVFTFEANYQDVDEDEDVVYWAIRADTCSGTDMVGNAPASPFHPSTFDPVTGEFETTVDMSSWDAGQYCLVINPREDAGAEDLRETRTFTLESDGGEPVDDMNTITGYKWQDDNGNGEWDDDESGLRDWTIYLATETGTTSTTTDATGKYTFEVPNGWYEVYEEQRDGWTQTAPMPTYSFLSEISVIDEETEYGTCTYHFYDDDELLRAFAQLETEYYNPINPEECNFGNQPDEIIDEEPDPETDPDPEQQRSSSFSSGTRTSFNAPEDLQAVLGASSTMCPFLTDHMQISWNNNPWEVIKLQLFLSMVMGYDNPVTGVFGSITDQNVKAFQAMFQDEILTPWFEAGIVPHNEPTGFVYKTTKWKINDIVCPGSEFPSLEGEDLNSDVDVD